MHNDVFDTNIMTFEETVLLWYLSRITVEPQVIVR